MILLGHFLIALSGLLGGILNLFYFLFIIRFILSWVNPDPSNMIVQFLYSATEPVLALIRKRVPPIGIFDLSIVIVLLFLYFLQAFLVASINHYGQLALQAASSAP